jgi:hypothetical protein
MTKSIVDDKLEQTRCRISNEGHRWMVGWYDELPPRIRQRLRQSKYNLCAACLVTIYLRKVPKPQRGLSREQALFAAIEIYEREEREALNHGR